MRVENSMKVWANTPWARSRCSTFGSILASSSACWPLGPMPSWPASASKPFFHASKSPPHSTAMAGNADASSKAATKTCETAIAAVRKPMAPSGQPKRQDRPGRPKTGRTDPMQCSPPVAKYGQRRSIDYFAFAFNHFFQAATLPLKTLTSALPFTPGTLPVPVYCQKVKGWPPYLSLGWPATERSQ